MRGAGLTILIVMMIGLVSCGPGGDIEERLAALESAKSAMTRRISEAEKEVFDLKLNLMDANAKLFGIEYGLSLLSSQEGELDPTAKGFTVVKADNGHFLVSCENVVPYGDGQKITMSIGNPYNMTFQGITLTARWGPRPPAIPPISSGDDSGAFHDWSVAHRAWQDSLRKRRISLTDDLLPGHWNRVTMVLAPAKVEEVGFIGVSIETDRISLYKP